MKRVITFIVFCLLMCGVCIADSTSGAYTYKTLDDGTICITKCNRITQDDVYVPEMIDGKIVSTIGEGAFEGCQLSGRSITLPDCIKVIERFAFKDLDINRINIPLGLMKIEEGAFCGSSVNQFKIESGHTVYATIDGALYEKTTKTLIAWPKNQTIKPIPNGIVKIGDYAFYGVTIGHITEMFPDSITEIGKYSFANAEVWLENVNFTSVDDYAFYGADIYLHSDYIGKRLKYIGNYAFCNACIMQKYWDSRLGMYVPSDFGGGQLISSEDCIVQDYAFFNVKVYGKALDISHVKYIGAYAFASDKDITAPKFYDKKEYREGHGIYVLNPSNGGLLAGVDYVGEYAFRGIWLYDNNILTIDKQSQLSEGAFYGLKCRSKEGESYVINVNIGKYVNTISKEAFRQSSVRNITMANSVTAIDDEAFYGCINIKDLALGDKVETIGKQSFAECDYLEKVTLPKTLKAIGERAFYGCNKLNNVSIPENVALIEKGVFDACADGFILDVKSESFAEIWARNNRVSYHVENVQEDTSWLLN